MGNSSSSRPAVSDRPLAAIILAAGKGTRMNSDLPKVAHIVAGRAMVSWVVDVVREVGGDRIVIVVGHAADAVRAIFEDDDGDIDFAIQDVQQGTGHATRCAQPLLDGFEGDVLVLAGDGPLLRMETIEAMLARHRAAGDGAGAAATLATSVIDDPTGYGRVVRDADGRFEAIVEHKNATDAQRLIHEVYPSYACFDAHELFTSLDGLEPDPVSGEYYMTELPAMIRAAGGIVELVDEVPPEDVLSINTPEQLAEVEAILTSRLTSKTRAAE